MTPGGRSNRERGDYFERQAKAALEVHGWLVIRSAGSYGVADLVALRADDEGRPVALLVSCKISGRIGPAERMALLDAARQTGALPRVAMRPKGGHVLIASVVDGTHRLVPLDTLKVPAGSVRAVAPPRFYDEAPDSVRDRLTPAGVQLTIPTDT